MISAPASAVNFNTLGKITDSRQFDAAIDAKGKIHLISDKYYQFNLNGKRLVEDSAAQDFQQHTLSFPPAISLDPLGNAHVLVRSTGTFDQGMDITYRVRNSDGNWQYDTRNYRVGQREKRNYVLGLAAISETEVYAHYGVGGASLAGNVRFWELEDEAARNIGNWSNVWRVDLDTRMRAYRDTVYFASANSTDGRSVYFSMGKAGESLLPDLKNNVTVHNSGSSRKGNPDIAIDNSGAAHLVYGAYHQVYYNRYKANGDKVYKSDKPLLNNLGDWHMGFGISSIGVSDDGQFILVIGLKANGNKEAKQSQIVITYSTDGGESWSEQADTGFITDGGEGRMRPRVLDYGEKFVLIYFDDGERGLSLATIEMESLVDKSARTALVSITALLLE